MTKWTEEDRKKVFKMYTEDEMSGRQIHEKTGIPIPTVTWLINKQKQEMNVNLPKRKRGTRKYYSNTFKLKVINHVIKDQKDIDFVSSETGVLPMTLYNWVARFKRDTDFVEKLLEGAEFERIHGEYDPKDTPKERKKKARLRKNTKYTDQIKLVALSKVLEEGMSIPETAQHLGINRANISNWLSKHQEDPEYYENLEISVAKQEYDYYNNIGSAWYLDKEDLEYLKELIEQGYDDDECAYICDVHGADYRHMKAVALEMTQKRP